MGYYWVTAELDSPWEKKSISNCWLMETPKPWNELPARAMAIYWRGGTCQTYQPMVLLLEWGNRDQPLSGTYQQYGTENTIFELKLEIITTRCTFNKLGISLYNWISKWRVNWLLSCKRTGLIGWNSEHKPSIL